MKKDYKLLAIIILVLFIVFNNNTNCNNNREDIDTRDTISSVSRIDTTVISVLDTHRRDTTIYNVIHKNIVVHPNTDSSINIIESSTNINDSLLDISVKAYSLSPVDSFKVSYNPKFPVIVTKFITKETETVLEERKKFQLYAGLMLSGGRNSFGLAPMIHFKSRRENIISLGYDLSRSEIKFGYAVKISFKKK